MSINIELQEETTFQQNKEGKEARREIQRRKLVGYCDGTNIQRIVEE